MSPRPRRRTTTSDLRERIIAAAWEQIAFEGAPALSLRAIARALCISAPSIYNYFPDRDALVTALIIEAYYTFGTHQLEARDAVPADDLRGRMKSIGLAYRTWALAFPQRYQLIFGTPIPGYAAPIEQIFPTAARSLSALVSVVEALRQAGKLKADNFPQIREDFKVGFEQWKTYGGQVDSLSLSVAMLIWARVHGLVSLEIAGNIPPCGPDGSALYRFELESVEQQFIQP
ncbi:MAG: TetR family transcriptional regulator [Chloroflexi bacterium]|nr:MAG: TetR family transcriptional regulator [Chloroflexota bacterium]MBA4376881.1 TetR family transcriptional regulator [Anaerolinea sp.]